MVRRITKTCGMVMLMVLWVAGAWAQTPDLAASDFNDDDAVNFADFLIFARGFGSSAGDSGYDSELDLNGDGKVDFADFLLFAQNYGRSGSDAAPSLLYITDLLAGRLVVINTSTNLWDLGRTIELSQPRGLAFSTINRRIYVAGVDSFYALDEASERVFHVRCSTPRTAREMRPPLAEASRSPCQQTMPRAFVTEEFVNRVEIIDLKDGVSEGSIAVGTEPVGIAASANGRDVLVAGKDRWIYLLDAEALATRDSLDLGGFGNGRIVLSPDGSMAYTVRTLQTSTPSVQIVGIDLSTGLVAQFLELVTPGDFSTQVTDLDLSADGKTLFAARQRLAPADAGGVSAFVLVGSLIAIDLDTFTLSGEAHVGDQVGNLGLAPDGRTAYVSGISSFLQDPAFKVFIVDLETMQAVGSLPGFDLPVEIRLPAAKRTGLPDPLPQLGFH